MKNLLLLPIAVLPLLLSGCETAIVARHPSRSVVIERDSRRYYDRRYADADRYDRPYRRDVVVVDPRRDDRRYDRRYDYRDDRRDVVVVNPRVSRPQIEVRYQSDSRGRYYIKNGRRVYVNSGVYY